MNIHKKYRLNIISILLSLMNLTIIGGASFSPTRKAAVVTFIAFISLIFNVLSRRAGCGFAFWCVGFFITIASWLWAGSIG